MNTATTAPVSPRHAPTVGRGVALYLGYLAIVFTTWTVNGADYRHIGDTVDSTRRWYALPTLFGSAFLVVALTVLGWWRLVLFDRNTCGPRWAWILPLTMAAIILNAFLALSPARLSPELLLWSTLGAVGVGFGEEMITRGSLVVGLRSRFTEGQVWLLGTLAFSALHLPNVLFGLPLVAMPIQLALTFIIGGGFFAMRRLSGTLLLPMGLHGLWDSALFLGTASGATPSLLQVAAYPVAIACTIAVVAPQWRMRLDAPAR